MAYYGLSVTPDVEFIGGAKVRPVLVASGFTVPHDIYFEYRYPSASYTPQDVRAAALGYSLIIEDLYQIAGVAAVSWTQIETPQGLLQDGVNITVSSTSGNSSDDLVIPFSKLSQNVSGPGVVSAETQVADLRAKLDAIEA